MVVNSGQVGRSINLGHNLILERQNMVLWEPVLPALSPLLQMKVNQKKNLELCCIIKTLESLSRLRKGGKHRGRVV